MNTTKTLLITVLTIILAFYGINLITDLVKEISVKTAERIEKGR